MGNGVMLYVQFLNFPASFSSFFCGFGYFLLSTQNKSKRSCRYGLAQCADG